MLFRSVGAYKISAVLALSVGVTEVVRIASKHSDKPLIYDHQKAGTDIPETGQAFAAMLKQSGISALIIFPLAGPATQTAWTNFAKEVDLPVIVGARMTHENFLLSEGGYIDDSAVDTIFERAAHAGVTDFVVPGNKPEVFSRVRRFLSPFGIDPVFYAPGFIAQGGVISEAAKVAGPRWHAIVGRAIYDAKDILQATLEVASAL